MKTNKPNMQTKTNTKTNSKNPKSGSEHGFRSSNHQGEAEQQQQAQQERKRSSVINQKAFEAMQAAAQWRGVLFSGPQPAQDKEGEEIPQWTVAIVDKEHAPCSRVYVCHSFERGESLAQAMSKDRGFELVNEAMPA